VPDDTYYRDQSRRCRRLAKLAQPREKKILLDLADEYDAKAQAEKRGEP
jgi:hypothetical protein